MSGAPANVVDTTQQIIDSGIAAMMLKYEPSFTPIDNCDFWVEPAAQFLQDEGDTVAVHMARRGQLGMCFPTGPGRRFGPHGSDPLSDEQLALVQRLAEAYRLAT